MYFVGIAAGKVVDRSIDKIAHSDNEESKNWLKGTFGVLSSVGFYALAIAFWQFTDSVNIAFFTPSFLLGYFVIAILALAYVIKVG